MERTSPTADSSPSHFLNLLPTEMLHQIIQDISRPFLEHTVSSDSTYPTPAPTAAAQALQTLSSLSLTSRRFHDITLPILYREFALGYTDIPGTHLTPQMGQRTAQFAQTLLARRDLAALVKQAFLHPKLVELMGEENRETICAAARKALDHEIFNDQSIEVLFFALMPNLERLVFAGCSWVPMPLAVRAVAWKSLKGPEMVEEYGWSFSEGVLLKKYEEELVSCSWNAIPDEDDDL